MDTEVPEMWKKALLGDVLDRIVGGGTPSRDNTSYWFGDLPWATVKDLKGLRLSTTEETITEDGLRNSASNIIPANTLIIATRMALGKAVLFDKDVAINQDLKAIFPKVELHTEYLFHWFQFKSDLIASLGSGSTVKGIRLEVLKALSILLPPVEEQVMIAEILSTVDEKIEVIEEQITQTTELKKGLMQRLLTKGIGHTQFKDSPLGEIPESWEVKPLSMVGEFSKGKGITKSQLTESGLPCIRYGEIYTIHHYIIKKFYSFIPTEIAQESKLIQENDILFAGSGETLEEIGKCVAYLDNQEAYAGGDIIILSPTEGSSAFLSFFLNSNLAIKQRRKMGQGNAVVHIYSRDLAQLLVPFPPIKEQEQIATTLLTIDEKLEILQIRIENYQELKKGLMQQLLTGKLRVNHLIESEVLA
ncbi:MAG TPA: restriction endonuclease subunit S [Flavisolibacter sp.]|nr:restriction endonuclease subunit S [Flavisolibacter sp.]